MHRWPILTGALLCSSCLAYDAQADGASAADPPAATAPGSAEEVGVAAAPLLDDPCNRACATAAYEGCSYVSQLCSGDAAMSAAIPLDGTALPCSGALPAGCGGMIGLEICVSDCSH